MVKPLQRLGGSTMTGSSVRWMVLPMLLAVATGVAARNKCMATGQMGGQAFNLTQCEVAYYEGSQGVTICFSSTPISPEERDFLQSSSSTYGFRNGARRQAVGQDHRRHCRPEASILLGPPVRSRAAATRGWSG